MTHENELGDVRYAFPRKGVVVKRDDPLGLSRVKVRIPGLIEPESAWALPMGTHGGSAQRGFKFTPKLGAEVTVFFIGGDPDSPEYLAAHWGVPDAGSEMPTDVKDLDPAKDTPEDVNCIETDTFAITIDDRPGKENLKIRNKKTDDRIEFDGTTATGPGMLINARAALVITVDGLFSVDASSIILNGRKLNDGGQGI